ncbi:MAG: prealbumin-like fold domain-containing protein [Eubacteriales bacterium]
MQSLLVCTPDIPLTVHVNLNKTSSNPEITNGNSYYSLAGAVYGVYTEWGCYNEVGRLTTDEWGNTNTLELNAGTYYIKEITAPTGYAMDYTAYEAVVTASQTTTVYVQDIPQSDLLLFCCINRIINILKYSSRWSKVKCKSLP